MEPARRPVVADVAELADVSTMTVSRVLNGSPRVSEPTRRRVQAAVDELGYRVNPAARVMRGGRSRTLGVVAIATDQFGPSHALFGIESAARAARHAVSFVTMPRPDRAALGETVEQLKAAYVDGIVVVAPFQPIVDAAAEFVHEIPIVVVGSGPTSGLLTAAVDQEMGAQLATQHLLDLGHGTIHHVAGPRESIDASRRIAGWRAAIRADHGTSGRLIRSDWSARGGYQASSRLAADPGVHAIFVANDQMALGVIRAVTDAGRSIPHDVSVVGFDDTPESAFYRPALTTIRQDLGEAGRQAVASLIARVEGRECEQHVSVPAALVVRNSTGPPPAG